MGEITAEMLDPREILGDGYRHAYGFIYHPDGWFGHGGGDPGVACFGVAQLVLFFLGQRDAGCRASRHRRREPSPRS